jgi:hypothetical protein
MRVPETTLARLGRKGVGLTRTLEIVRQQVERPTTVIHRSCSS